MTHKERAVKATWDTDGADWTTWDRERLEVAVERAIIAAVEEEREACAQLCDEEVATQIEECGEVPAYHFPAAACAKAIRARSNASHSAEPTES